MKRTFNHTAASYKNNTNGNVGMMFAFSSLMLIGLLAVGVDLTNGLSAKQRLQDTTDAVALMAAQDKTLNTPAKLEQAAQALYDATYPGQRGIRIEIENIARDGDKVTVTTRNNIDTYFSNVFNTSDLNVGSGQSKIQGLRTAANGLIETFDDLDNDDLRLGVVPFGQYMNVGVTNSRAGWLDFSHAPVSSWKGCVGSRTNGNDETPTRAGGGIPALPGNLCGSEILPLTSDMNKARASINGLDPKGLTYIPSGITWGWRALEGEIPTIVPNPPKNTDHKNVMVIMTDGENTRSKSGLTHNAGNINEANDKTARLCERVKGDGIEVYTITYALDDKKTKALMRDCASDGTKFFDATTATDLNAAFDEIGRNLDVLRTTS